MPPSDPVTIHVAIPVLDEYDRLPETLNTLHASSWPSYTVCICINQPNRWWNLPEKQTICERNQATLAWLRSRNHPRETILDCTSPGKGWKSHGCGVGHARKTIMDHIIQSASPQDIILSLDADTAISPTYFHTIASAFLRFPDALGVASLYHHPLPPDPSAARAILRYEIYMRHYLLNLWRIGSPYAFTALGSAMACRVSAYIRVGGLTPKGSGEDFYFLQKLRKAGDLIALATDPVFPDARFSDRVGFGTGPAMIRGARGDWQSYPIYATCLFDQIREAYTLFPHMHASTPNHPVFQWLASHMHDADPFEPLRVNFKKLRLFVKACHEKLDGLRILQYLKEHHHSSTETDEERFLNWMHQMYPEYPLQWNNPKNECSFSHAPIGELEEIREFLYQQEIRVRTTAGPLLPGWLPPEG